jgi:hypothetical protein
VLIIYSKCWKCHDALTSNVLAKRLPSILNWTICVWLVVSAMILTYIHISHGLVILCQ